jgi:NDP-sugar pyrophosphorylase family protein
MKIIIPLSGIGQRFINAGYKTPKPLIEVDGLPIINHVINLFPNEKDFIFICNDKHLKETDMRHILLKIMPTCKIIEVPVENRKGPVDAVTYAYDLIHDNDEVIVSYCDYGTYWNYNDFLEKVRNSEADGAIPAYIGFHPHMLGNDNYAFMKHSNMWMNEIQEKKPFTDNKMNEYASNGTYYFKTGSILKKYFNILIERNLNLNGEFYVSMVYNLLIENGLKVLIYEIENMLQWGTPYDLEIYNMWSSYFKTTKINKTEDNKNTFTILPMAGKGSRFEMVGYKTAKPFLDINGLPMVIQAINDLPKTKNLVIITLKEHFDKYNNEFKLINDYYPNVIIKQIDEVTNGQATTCSIFINDMDDNIPILISACDNGVYYDNDKYQELVNNDDIDVIVWSFNNNPTSKLYPHMYAWLDVDDKNNLELVSVKKPLENKPNIHSIIGTMLFKKASIFKEGYKYICDNNIKTNGEFYVDDMLNPLIKMGYKIKIFPVDYYLCWGTPNDYKTYNYWENFFNKCHWHPYKSSKQITIE